jgi:hypothetical protein
VPLATNAPQQTASLFDHLVGAGIEARMVQKKVSSRCAVTLADTVARAPLASPLPFNAAAWKMTFQLRLVAETGHCR